MSNPKLQPPTWVRRSYPFAGVEVGGHLIEKTSIKYFRSAASRWFRKHGRRYYTYIQKDRKGNDYVTLVRLEDLPPPPAKRAPSPNKKGKNQNTRNQSHEHPNPSPRTRKRP